MITCEEISKLTLIVQQLNGLLWILSIFTSGLSVDGIKTFLRILDRKVIGEP